MAPHLNPPRSMLIAHASDLTGDDAAAFLHAAALARNGSRFLTIHAGNGGEAPSPTASELAARWGRPIDHELRRVEREDDVSDSVLEALRQLRPDLVVVGTHVRHGLTAWLRGSVGEAIARNLEMPVLVVPNQSRGFVDPATGELDLHRILVPAGNAHDGRRGVEAARRLAWIAGAAAGMEIVHAGPDDPGLESLGLTITRITGVLEHAIVEAARARDACLIVMPTRGHDGLGDLLLGSHTERVIHETSCPVLSVPI
ncbi:MAG TPA: universal stress protein [Kofleriaceae bacterium]|nr:universal stress protein [Kofleriaceae bacterium]